MLVDAQWEQILPYEAKKVYYFYFCGKCLRIIVINNFGTATFITVLSRITRNIPTATVNQMGRIFFNEKSACALGDCAIMATAPLFSYTALPYFKDR